MPVARAVTEQWRMQERAAEVAATEAALLSLTQQLSASKGDLESRAAALAAKQAALERSAAGLQDLEATLSALSSSASQKAAEEVDILMDLQNTIRSERSVVHAGSAEMGKTAKQACPACCYVASFSASALKTVAFAVWPAGAAAGAMPATHFSAAVPYEYTEQH
jgi:hypothetical protein